MQSKRKSNDEIFATPLNVGNVADCYFYHTMELPGHGVIEGRDWDLRGRVDEYLGKVDFAGQRVLEIGPASGFLTFEMEKRGADVVSVEVTEEHGWDFVPYPAARLEEVFSPRRIVMRQLKNSYWFSHAALQSKAKVYYGDAYNLPAALGEFDIAVMGAVLLHCRDPLRIVEQCGKRAKTLIIVDKFHPDLEGAAGMPSGADAGEFLLAHMVAFQHAIFHPISGGDGISRPRSRRCTSSFTAAEHTRFSPSSDEENDAITWAEKVDSAPQSMVKSITRISATVIRNLLSPRSR